MLLPRLTDPRSKKDRQLKTNSIAQFMGLNVTNECTESEFSSMHNLSLNDFPHLTTRQKRLIADLKLTNIKGILGGENLYIVSTDKITTLKPDGTAPQIAASFTNDEKTLVKMGNYLCIFPDKKVYDGSTVKSMATSFQSTSVTFSLTNAKGEAITYHNAAYYEEHDPQDGDYLLTEIDGKSVLQQYSISSNTWVTITTAYVMATATGIGANLNEFDGVKISLNLQEQTWAEVDNVLPMENNGVHYATYPIKAVSANSITFSGLITATKALTSVVFKVEREVPNIAYVTEAMNRLWACNSDGTEIYATKLGDPLNWNCFEGISTDSWAVTIGSDGIFTGAVTYLGYPTFFKENSLIKIAISNTGAHQTKETICRGVQKNCSKSLTVVNEVLFYKARTSICAYDGSLPQNISKKLGDLSKFTYALGGRNKEKYYISCYDGVSENHIYVYDTLKGLWAEDDNTLYMQYATWNNILVGVYDKVLHLFDKNTSVSTTEEEYSDIKWQAETRPIDYVMPEAKYVHRIVIKAYMETKARAAVWIKYDDMPYTRLFEMKSVGTKVYPLSIIPRRCDHFQIKLEGQGKVTIYQITKTLETGSDIQ